MAKEPDVKQRVEQFYKLLASHGLNGRPERLTAKKRRSIDKLFPND